jgi:DNA-nicking Smr family endonuclease
MNRRRLSDDERTLWQGVTRSIAPLRKATRLPAPTQETPRPAAPSRRAKPLAETKPAAPAPKSVPQEVVLGRKLKRRVARGAHAIDGRLDLHGMTQAQAHDALLRFLRSRQARGAKLVLIITGKGTRAGESERGVLKRMVPQWLRLAEFRNLVAGFESASIAHGGEGALYVTLRRL